MSFDTCPMCGYKEPTAGKDVHSVATEYVDSSKPEGKLNIIFSKAEKIEQTAIDPVTKAAKVIRVLVRKDVWDKEQKAKTPVTPLAPVVTTPPVSPIPVSQFTPTSADPFAKVS